MISIRGAKIKCKDDISKIENYDKAIADTTQKWVCHHRLELTLNGEFAHLKKELERLGMYYKRPYFELIFLTRSEHEALHKGTEEHKLKLSKGHKGKKHSKETKEKMSKTHIRSDFGRKFKEHYGFSKTQNINLYSKECAWYHNHNHKCRWEK